MQEIGPLDRHPLYTTHQTKSSGQIAIIPAAKQHMIAVADTFCRIGGRRIALWLPPTVPPCTPFTAPPKKDNILHYPHRNRNSFLHLLDSPASVSPLISITSYVRHGVGTTERSPADVGDGTQLLPVLSTNPGALSGTAANRPDVSPPVSANSSRSPRFPRVKVAPAHHCFPRMVLVRLLARHMQSHFRTLEIELDRLADHQSSRETQPGTSAAPVARGSRSGYSAKPSLLYVKLVESNFF